MSYAMSCPSCGSTRCAVIGNPAARCKGPDVCINVGCDDKRFDGSRQCQQHYPHTQAVANARQTPHVQPSSTKG